MVVRKRTLPRFIALNCLTLGIYLLWVEPWITTARAKFYEELKARQN